MSMANCQTGCLVCNNVSDQCVQCSERYILDGKKCKKCPKGCLSCSLTGKCDKCIKGYALISESCQELENDSPDIKKLDSTCDYHYGLGENNECIRCMQTGCRSCYSNYLECDSCEDSYILVNNQCQMIPEGCRSYSEDSKCTKCESGYSLDSSGHCLKCPYGCDSCNENYPKCEKCSDGYGFDDSKQCVKCTDGCDECYDNYKECTSCSDGYGLDDSKQCVKCSDGCKKCSENYKECTYCNWGYGLDDTKKCLKCMSDNCEVCFMNYKECTSCSWGYGLDDTNKCSKCITDNCGGCSSNYKECYSCGSGYALDNSKQCVKITENCGTREDGKCIYCESGYGFDESNNCVKCSDSLCSKCNKYSVCDECDESYGFDSNKQCTMCQVIGCTECYQDANSCTRCEDGYYLEYDQVNKKYNKCIKIANCDNHIYANNNITCERCKTYFGKNEKNECVPCKDKNCVNCFDDYSVCSSCVESQTVDNNKDSSTYGECISCKVQNCAQCYSNIDKCDNCMDGYHGDECQKCPDNCRRCNQKGICTEPMLGYYINNEGQLSKCSQGCVTCKDNTTCNECADKHRLIKNECIPVPHDHCDYFYEEYGEVICTYCEEGYYLVDNQCNKIEIANCISFYDSKCQFCDLGYVLINNECKKCNDNCNSCDNVDKCIQCSYGYYLQDGKCHKCNQPNCISCMSSEPYLCLQCNMGFALDVRPNSETFGKCFQCDVENCLWCGNYMDGSDRCTQCKEGFELADYDKKCIPDEFSGNSGNDKKDNKGGSKLSTGAIIGIVVGCVVVVGLVVFLLVYFLVIRKSKVGCSSSQTE